MVLLSRCPRCGFINNGQLCDRCYNNPPPPLFGEPKQLPKSLPGMDVGEADCGCKRVGGLVIHLFPCTKA